jgi:hypothetical protein
MPLIYIGSIGLSRRSGGAYCGSRDRIAQPPLRTRLHAAAAGERRAAPLEALRTAGKAAYDELLQAEGCPVEAWTQIEHGET